MVLQRRVNDDATLESVSRGDKVSMLYRVGEVDEQNTCLSTPIYHVHWRSYVQLWDRGPKFRPNCEDFFLKESLDEISLPFKHSWMM